MCGEAVPGPESERYAEYGGIACSRSAGHSAEHIARMDRAAQADGARGCCRVPIEVPHHAMCVRKGPMGEKP